MESYSGSPMPYEGQGGLSIHQSERVVWVKFKLLQSFRFLFQKICKDVNKSVFVVLSCLVTVKNSVHHTLCVEQEKPILTRKVLLDE